MRHAHCWPPRMSTRRRETEISASGDPPPQRLMVRAAARIRNHVRNSTAMPEPNASRGQPTRVLSTADHEFGRDARPFTPKTLAE
jgi:hypothetical protein